VKLILDSKIMQAMMVFDRVTRKSAKDCLLQDDTYIFIIPQHTIAQAVGKHGSNVKKLQELFKKRVKIVEYSPDLQTFVKNVIMPLQAKEIVVEDTLVVITAPDSKTRGLLIGRGAKNLRKFEEVVKRHFPIDEIKVE